MIPETTVYHACACPHAHGVSKSVYSMRVMIELISVFAVFVVVTAYAQGNGNATARALKNPVPATPASVTAGAATYKKYCAFCHGADAKGDGPLAPKDSNPPNLIDATTIHGGSDGEMFTVITNGAGPNTKMVGFKGKLSDQDIWYVVNYLRSLAAKNATH